MTGLESIVKGIVDVIATASRLERARVAAAPAADLLVDLGLDSIQLLEVWMSLENQFGIASGLLGGAQATTVEALTRAVVDLTQSKAQTVRAQSPAVLLDESGIEALLPHRGSMRLLDQVTELEPGRRGDWHPMLSRR